MNRLTLGAALALPLLLVVCLLVAIRRDSAETRSQDQVQSQQGAQKETFAARAIGPLTFEQAWARVVQEKARQSAPPPPQKDEIRIPVLCYHRIDNVRGDFYHTTREMFEWQMKWLAENADVISSALLVDWVRYRQGLSDKAVTLPSRPVVIHFDDNYRSVHEVAWPILKRYKLPWTFFVYRHHHQPISEQNLRAIAASGVDIQAHSMTHPWFHKPARGQSMQDYIREMHWQVGGCKKYLEGISGRPVNQFAWPFGTYSDLSIVLAARYGFVAMYAADGGYVTAGSSLSSLERVLVTKGWTQEYFKNVVSGKARLEKVFKPAWILPDREQARKATEPRKDYL